MKQKRVGKMNALVGKIGAIVLAVTGFTVSAQAFEEAGRVKKATSLSQVVTHPDKVIGRPILVKNVQCADVSSDGILCTALVGGKVLRITAQGYGMHVSAETLEHILEQCKGTANMLRDTCTFSVQIEPASEDEKFTATEYGTIPVVAIFSREIDLFREN